MKIGNRINLELIVTEKWQSEAGVKNAIITSFDNEKVNIRVDIESGEYPYKRLLNSGTYNLSAYKTI